MSNHTRRKSNELKVKHLFSGKKHFFEVQSDEETYNTIVQVSCDCRYMSLQGIKQRKMCSHILAALKHIVNNAEINQNGAS